MPISREFWNTLLTKIGYEESDSWDDGFTLTNGQDAYLSFFNGLGSTRR